MKKLGFIQEWIGGVLLNLRTKKNNRTLNIYNFDNAKTIGILYDASLKENHTAVTNFASLIQRLHSGPKIEMLGYLSNPNLEQCLPQVVSTKYFSAKDFSWNGCLLKGNATDFIKKRYDILLDITTETSYPLHYVMLLSNASFKVGRYIENDLRYDLLLDTKKENTIDYLITQITVYLSKIKVKE